jgi:ATP-dependent protease ClpP protease subunit
LKFRAALAALVVLFSSVSLAKTARYDVDLFGAMTGDSLAKTLDQLNSAQGPEVTFRISSPGGEAIATFVFIELAKDIKAAKGLHVTCVGTVMVASAAAILLESPVCDVRIIEPATVVLFHAASGGTRGKAGEQEDDLKLLQALNYMAAAMVAPRIGMTPEEYLSWIGDRDRWLSSAQCLERGIVDEVRLGD